MAALGTSGVIFACTSLGQNPATLYFRPIVNWNQKNEWLLTLTNEEPKGSFHHYINFKVVALCKDLIVVATDQNYLRFFSLGGVQRGVQCLKGSIVSMVGNDSCIMVVYHAGSNYLAGQNIEFMLIVCAHFTSNSPRTLKNACCVKTVLRYLQQPLLSGSDSAKKGYVPESSLILRCR
jgi:hypothetical protein